MTEMTTQAVSSFPAIGDRLAGAAMRRGARGLCPACGEGRLLSGYLKVRDHCPSCGEALHHQRADDGPAYVTIVIVSHILTPLVLIIYTAWRPSPFLLSVSFCAAAVIMSLLLLPRIKGAWVGLQWAKRMHGFGNGAPDRPAPGDARS